MQGNSCSKRVLDKVRDEELSTTSNGPQSRTHDFNCVAGGECRLLVTMIARYWNSRHSAYPPALGPAARVLVDRPKVLEFQGNPFSPATCIHQKPPRIMVLALWPAVGGGEFPFPDKGRTLHLLQQWHCCTKFICMLSQTTSMTT
jgi:hypothetical protein